MLPKLSETLGSAVVLCASLASAYWFALGGAAPHADDGFELEQYALRCGSSGLVGARLSGIGLSAALRQVVIECANVLICG